MPVALIDHKEDPRTQIYREAGDLNDIEVFNNKVLVAIYNRAGTDKRTEAKTLSGIIIPQTATDEDDHQSKVGMILKMGPIAFIDKKNDPPIWFIDQTDDMAEGDWVFFSPSNGFRRTLVSIDPKTGLPRHLLCRILDDTSIEGRVEGPMGPDRVY